MEIETMFVEQKWNILHHLASGDYSPLQLAEKTNTTISNVSQQLKLLEAAKLVQKKKMKNRDKGKPRALFSLSSDYAYLISVTKDFTSKKFITLTDYHKTMLKIWSIKNPKLHSLVSDAYRQIIGKISEFECVYLSEEQNGEVTLNLVYNGSKEAAKMASIVNSNFGKVNSEFAISQIKADSFRKKATENKLNKENSIVLYDPRDMFGLHSKQGINFPQ